MPEMLPPRAAIARQARFTLEDRAHIARCRYDHTRLGFAYQLAFVRLTGRLPRQHPLEVVDDLLRYVALQLNLEDRTEELIERYASRRPTVSEHVEQLRRHLGVRSFGVEEREALRRHLREEAAHLERPAGLVAHAEEHLRREGILLPATSTLGRIVGEVRAEVMDEVYRRIGELLADEVREDLDTLLIVDEEAKGSQMRSPLQALKEPPGTPSPRALVAETEKLEAIRAAGALGVDLSWLRGSLRKALARRVRYSSAHRLRELRAPHRYAALVAFLQETHADTIDQIVDLHAKLVTQTYRRAERRLNEEVKQRRRSLMGKLQSLRTIGLLVLNDAVEDEELRQAILERLPIDKLRQQVEETEEWLTGKRSDVFPGVVSRFSYLRRFSPSFVGHLSFEADPASGSAQAKDLLESIEILRQMNTARKRKMPKDAPISFIPKSRRRFVERNGQIDRAAYEAAVLTALRDEVRRGNIAVEGSKRFGRLSDLFMPEEEWEERRQSFSERSELPSNSREAAHHLKERLRQAYQRFLTTLPSNTYVTFGENGVWCFGSDPAEQLDAGAEERLSALSQWIERQMRRVRLPDLLIEVDNELHFTRYLTPATAGHQTAQDVCEAVATVIAYGCNLGPHTMARLTRGVTYAQIKRIADWHLYEDVLRQALADVVNAISKLDTARVWGGGQSSSSDGQRFLFPRRTIKRTYSHRMGDYALEFYSFVADNYAPFYSTPIECTERDAAYVLDGLLYHEADLEIDEHYTDTHGYTECQFAAFAALGKRFCPRIRSLQQQRIYRADDDPARYGPLWPMLEARDRRLRIDWVEEQWDQIGRFFCSMATGHTTASVAMKRIHAFGGGNHFYRAVRELGRVFKTEFILEYLARPTLRRRVRQGLLKSEELHALARSVFYGKLGRADWRDFRRQTSTASCLTLILACIVYWQIKELERVLASSGDETDLDFDLLVHVSPVGWDNVTLYGEYDIRRELIELRSL